MPSYTYTVESPSKFVIEPVWSAWKEWFVFDIIVCIFPEPSSNSFNVIVSVIDPSSPWVVNVTVIPSTNWSESTFILFAFAE